MRANRVPGKAKREIGKMVIDYNHYPFEAENDLEEMQLYYLDKIGTALEEIADSTTGLSDNCVVVQLCAMEREFMSKLDSVIEELRLIRKGVK